MRHRQDRPRLRAASVHPAAHRPRLATAAAHPTPEPHREEPPLCFRNSLIQFGPRWVAHSWFSGETHPAPGRTRRESPPHREGPILLDDQGIADKTVVVFAGDNGAEECLPWRRTSGFLTGRISPGWMARCAHHAWSAGPDTFLFGGSAMRLCTSPTCSPPCSPGPGWQAPGDRVIDGVDQRVVLFR